MDERRRICGAGVPGLRESVKGFERWAEKLAKAATEIRKMHATVVPSHFLLSGPPAWPTHCG
jgi:hypothetical protein